MLGKDAIISTCESMVLQHVNLGSSLEIDTTPLIEGSTKSILQCTALSAHLVRDLGGDNGGGSPR